MANEDLEKTKKIEALEDFDLFAELKESEEQKPEEPQKKKKKVPKWCLKIKEWWQKKSKKQKGILIAMAIVLFATVGVLIYMLLPDKKEVPVIPPKEEVIIEEENYRYENGKLIFLNSAEEEIGEYACKNQDENKCFVSYYSNEDAFDTPKQVYEDETEILTRTPIIKENYVFLVDSEKEKEQLITLYDIKKQEVLEEYQVVKKASNEIDRFIVKNKEGNYTTIEFQENGWKTNDIVYDYLGFISLENYFVAKTNNRNLIINDKGKTLSKTIAGEIKDFTNKYIKIKTTTGSYQVVDYNGTNVLKESYDYVDLFADYAAVIVDGKLNLKFYDNTKLNEEAILLKNANYQKKNIYNEDNKLIETKSAYEIVEKEGIITIDVIDENRNMTKTINKFEGIVSKKTKNINYFDGKLYIYRDASKTDLLGIYACTNKNKIENENSTLANCYLAKDTVFEENDFELPAVSGYIPIFNERFLFVSDNPELVNENNQSVHLYDLKTGKILGKYMTVDTFTHSGLTEISFKTVNDLAIIAKNKNGKYGVIKLGLSEVAAHIPFHYTSLESIKDYYLAKTDEGYFLLNKTNGEKITSAIPVKIRSYNDEYVAAGTTGDYQVYDYKGKKITEQKYTFIELYANFFAAVNSNNKLTLYKYSKPNENILPEGKEVILQTKNYYGPGTLAFKINIEGKNYSIFIGTAANTYEQSLSGEIISEE